MDRGNLYYGEAIRQTNEQCESRRHFDTMAVQMLGFSAVSFSFILLARGHFTTPQLWFTVLSLCCFLLVAILTIFALKLRKWDLTPSLSDIYKNIESLEYTDEALTLWTGQTLSDSIDNNDNVLDSKADYLNYAYIFLVLEVMFIGITVLSSFFFHA